MSLPSFLVVEDDEANRRLMRNILAPLGATVHLAESGAAGLALALSERPLLTFMDLGLGDMHGLALLRRLRAELSDAAVIVLTGSVEVSDAVEAMRLGASNYFTKPFNVNQILSAARAALERHSLRGEIEDLRGRLAGAQLERVMGSSPAIKALQDEIRRAASAPFTALIQGETGSGKEVVARALHEESPRAAKPFVALDCGAIPESLLESELFGHEKGAFSGADRRRAGYFQQAEGGSLFLDEVGNLPLALQAKLLRVLQERQVRRLGATQTESVDVRVIAATHADLEEDARAGRFRQDLYFRLAEVRLRVPPLRERPEDLPALADRFLREAGMELKRPARGLSPEALDRLRGHDWPGNVRELRNLMRQAALAGGSATVEAEDLARLKPGLGSGTRGAAAPAPEASAGLSLAEIGRLGRAEAETRAIQEALRLSLGNISAAVRLLRTDNKSLHVKLKQYGIRARDYARTGEEG